MAGDESDIDVSRRHLGSLLAALGGAAGSVALASCIPVPPKSPEQAGIEDALDGTGHIDCVGQVASLRALVGAAHHVAILESYAEASPPDGGGGVFVWSVTPAVDDGGTIFNKGGLGTSSAGWRRLYSGALDVRWFGATGVASGDDTNAIRAAVDAVIRKGAGTVYFPFGTYSITRTLTIDSSHVKLVGEPGAIVQQMTSGQGAISFGSSAAIFDVGVEDLVIAGGVSGVPFALSVDKVSHSRFRHLKLTDATAGLRNAGAMVCCVFENIRVTPNEGGFTYRPTVGLDLGSSYSCTFINPILEGIAGPGISMTGGELTTFLGGTCEACHIGVHVGGAATGCVFDGIDFEVNSQCDVDCRGTACEFRTIRACSPAAAAAVIVQNDAGNPTSANSFRGGLYYNKIHLTSAALSTVLDGLYLGPGNPAGDPNTGGRVQDEGKKTEQRGVWDAPRTSVASSRLAAPLAVPVTRVSADYAMTQMDSVVVAASGATITLPSAASSPNVSITVKNGDAGRPSDIAPQGQDTIDGIPGSVTAGPLESFHLVSDGTSTWHVIGTSQAIRARKAVRH